ncbi:MAG: AMP-binding protein [Chitinivibrionales bacterium]|nr:AMP-binding protein [Chitinivibrionales bacterium]
MITFDPVLVHEWLRRTARRTPERTAVVCGDQRASYADVDRLSDRMARSLMECGVRRGDRVVILLDTSVETIVAIYGVLKAGAVFVALEGSVKAPKLAYVLADCAARVLVTHTTKQRVVADCADRFPDVWCDAVIWTGSGGSPDGVRMGMSRSWDWAVDERHDAHIPDPPRVIDVDLAALIYTSGSTGEPKGVMSTHRNMVSAARSIIEYIENDPDDVILVPLPLSFDYGLYQVLMAFMFGGTVVLETFFMYPETVLRTIERERITGLPIVPTIAAMLLRLQDLPRRQLASLRYITNTGAALPVEHIKRLREMLPNVRMYSMFGLTECKRVCFLPPDQLDLRPASVGKAIPNCETLIVDENGAPVAPGESGELVVRGSNVMQGYWHAPDATRHAYRQGDYPDDRRLHSGDYFRTDEEGFLYFLGRRDDLIKSRGERISAREVENVLCMMEGISEAAVVGVPDDVMGQAVKAFVVPADGSAIAERLVLRHCRANLESFMVPKYVHIVDTLPRTPHGKVDKRTLGITGVTQQ